MGFDMSPDEMMAQECSSQAFLDDVVTKLDTRKEKDWYNVDVKTILDKTQILSHEVRENGDSLVFLNSSVMYFSPKTGRMQHFPRSLVHCFVDDYRMAIEKNDEDDNVVFRGELFSVTPHEEQLCWILECDAEKDVPHAQASVAKWMSWLNRQ